MADEQQRKKAEVELGPTPSTDEVSNISKASVSYKYALDIADHTQFTQRH
jgi:hypothetical protein